MDINTLEPVQRLERRRGLLLIIGLLVATVLARLPALINAAGVHSDAAIIGLQARHMLQGEWSWNIWGAPYQGSFDALVIAAVFALFGCGPLQLMLAPLLGHLLLTGLTFDLLRRRTDGPRAAIACLLLVFAPYPINGVALYAPRQWSITAVVASAWLLDRAGASGRRSLHFAFGGLFAFLALYLDMFAILWLPALMVFGALCAMDDSPPTRERFRRFGWLGVGLLAGAVAVKILHGLQGAAPATPGMSLARAARNWDLMWSQCLPWILGWKVFSPGAQLFPDLWTPSWVFRSIQGLGAAVLLIGIISGGVALFFPRIPWMVRRVGALGAMVAGSSFCAFLVSKTPADMWSARYLAPIVWMAPFALVPAAHLLGKARFPAMLSPYVLSAIAGSWVAFGTYVNGPLPVRTARGAAVEEKTLGAELRRRNIHHAAAQYWLSYRLTFLFDEDPVVVPLFEDRYPPYRAAFDRSDLVAYIFHPSEPRAQPQQYEEMLRSSGRWVDRFQLADFTVLVSRH